MIDKDIQPSKSLQNQARNAFYISLITTIVMLVVAVIMLIVTGFPTSPIDLQALVMLVVVAGFVSTWLSRRNQHILGSSILISSLLFATTVTSLQISGMGAVLAAVAFVLTFAIASATLPARHTTIFTVVSAVLALGYLALDVFPLFERSPSEQIALTNILTVVLILLFGFLILRRFNQYNLRTKLTMAFIAVTILTIGTIAAFTINRTRTTLLAEAFNKLQAVEAIKVSELANYFSERKDDMQVLAQVAGSLREEGIKRNRAITDLKTSELVSLFQNWDADVQNMATDPNIVAGMSDLVSGFNSLGASRVRSLYQGKSDIDDARDGSDYSTAHQELHSILTQYIETQGYIDVFMINSSGYMVYSVRKGQSFAANLTANEYKDSNLTSLYQQLKNVDAGQTYLADVQLFDDEKALFIGSPIYQGRTFLGVLVYQLPLSEINAIVQNRSGLGETGETYLVGKVGDHNELRSDRVFKANNFIGDPKPGEDADQALAGLSGEVFKVGSTGVYEVSVFSPLPIETPGLQWAILTTISVEEMMAPQPEGAQLDMLAQFKETYGYYDVFLISPDGYIFYTVAHEPDFRTNILTGPYQNSNLAELVADIIENQQPVEIVDFKPYAPSLDAPAGFFAAPVFYQGEVALVVAAQISLADINAIMSERSGLGESGETYVVGQDNLFRNDSRFLDQLGVDSTILNEDWPVDTVAASSALNGGTGTEVIADYRGVPVLSSWSPMVLRAPDENYPEGIVWAFMAEIDEAEALQPIEAQTRTILLVAIGIVGLSVVAGLGLSQLLANPITRLTGAAQQIMAGDLSIQTEITTQDEVGVLATAFNNMTAELRTTLEGLEQQVADRTRALETSTEVSRRISTILDQQQLVREVVEQLRSAFGYYHVHIYFFDDAKQNLEMAGGTGDAGRTMLARGHKIEKGHGLVGRAAETNEIVLVPDVSQAEGWLPNPLLPETKSEVAVPIAVGPEVIGVLDVQHNVTNGLSEQDADLIQAIANQVGIAAQNTQAYEQAQRQAVREARITAISQRIQSATTIEEVLQVAVSELGSSLGSRAKAEIRSPGVSNGNK